jgi:hypothetical protein
MKEKKSAAAALSHSTSGSAATDTNSGSLSADGSIAVQPAKQKINIGAAVGALLFAGLASPFLELQGGFSGVIGLVIIFVGMRIAWKMTGAPRLEILGPFQANAPPQPARGA